MKTLGPLTLAIMLSNENKWQNKIINALRESIRMLPMADQIIDCLKDMKSSDDAGALFKALGDVLSITGSRNLFPFIRVCLGCEKIS